MLKIISAMLLAMTISVTATAQTSHEVFKADVSRAADNYAAYPQPTARLTPAPKGYKPVYISHYGRHGSRQLIGKGVYRQPLPVLQEALADGQLTADGQRLLTALTATASYAENREEELSPIGHQQHREIAGRMYERFPEVFKGDVTLRANSSVVVRCILSMQNAVTELKGRNPRLQFITDASQHDMHYLLSWADKALSDERRPKDGAADKALRAFDKTMIDHRPFMNRIFASEAYWTDKVKNPRQLYDWLWKLMADMQSTPLIDRYPLYDLYTHEELYNMWALRNATWYIDYGPSPLNGGNQPKSQRPLLRKFVEEADSALALPRPGANLRYGHEVALMPLVCLMGLGGYDRQIADLASLDASGWRSYDIFPMGGNVQVVFYRGRKAADPVLVKVLLNEREVQLPSVLQPVSGPYYRWSDVRDYWYSKL